MNKNELLHKRSKIFVFSFILVVLPHIIKAQTQTPKFSNEFLSIGVGARALGMGNAFVSSVDDATSGYWNPASLTKINSELQLSGMHAEYFAGIAKYDYLSFGKPIDSVSAIGASLIRFGVDDIPNTTNLIDAEGNINYNNITSFSAADYAALFSYARELGPKGLTVGGNFKLVHRTVGNFANAWGFGLDASANYKMNKWTFSAVARDVTSTYNAWNFTLDNRTKEVFKLTGNEIPKNSLEITLPRLLLGASRKFNFGEDFTLLTELDLDITTDGKRNVLITGEPFSIDPHFGFELGYADFIYFRGGINNLQEVRSASGKENMTFQPNLGVGLIIKERLSIDYALTDIGDQSIALYSNIFSLKYDIFNL